jgi:hypothetical protein
VGNAQRDFDVVMGALIRQHRFESFVMSVACTVSSFESRVQLGFAAFDDCILVFSSQSAGLRYARPYLRLPLKTLDYKQNLVNHR